MNSKPHWKPVTPREIYARFGEFEGNLVIHGLFGTPNRLKRVVMHGITYLRISNHVYELHYPKRGTTHGQS